MSDVPNHDRPQRGAGPLPPGPLSLGTALRAASTYIDRLDARLLLQRVTGCSHADLIARADQLIPPEAAARFAVLVQRRGRGEPLAYLIGGAGFRGRLFEVTPAVLIPRPETELLVDLALTQARAVLGGAPAVLDLGTGSGIVAVSLALELSGDCPGATVTAVDVSPEALAVAAANAERLGAAVRFCLGSWYAPLDAEGQTARFDVIASNPPYIAYGDPHLLRNGLPHEPQLALTDGEVGGNGLACLSEVIRGARRHLRPGGWLLLEHGYDQADAVRALLLSFGFESVATWQDLAGIDRVSGACVR